jgi:hypothetical protein
MSGDADELRLYFSRNRRLRCFYCGRSYPTRWDHVHPVKKGGATVKGNLVPACIYCDDSKQDKTLPEWFRVASQRGRRLLPEAQILQRVSRYKKRYRYRAGHFPKSLDRDGQQKWRVLEKRLKDLREAMLKVSLIRKRAGASTVSLRRKRGGRR